MLAKVTPRPPRFVPISLVAALAALATGCGGGGGGGETVTGVTAVSTDSCGKVEYGGSGKPDALIVSDLPMRGDSSERSAQMVQAIRIVLDHAGWRAGQRRVAFQACDDSLAKTGLWDPARCRANARAYAADPDLIGVIGTYNSGCAEEMIPILDRAPDGGVAMVSPGNTLICLSEASPSCPRGELRSLYPTGRRDYARVVPNDAFQGAGLAKFAERSGAHRAFILYAGGDPTSLGQAKTFRGAAARLGMTIAGFAPWNTKASDYADLMRRVKRTGVDTLLLAGLIEQHGARLIEDKVRVLGPNRGPVQLLAPDGFAQQSTIDQAKAASAGMFVSVPGRVPQRLQGPGKRLVSDLKQKLGGKPVELYAPYAGQAAAVLLDAIGRGGGRGEVVASLLKENVRHGITGSFRILPSGDPSVGPITVSIAGKTFRPVSEIIPPASLVAAARHG
jgi:branched-chain amino acid transport system substrate-binding protein